MADFLNVSGSPWKALLVVDVRSYFDDSGTHTTSVATIIGGFVGTKDEWEEIEKPWRAVLSEFSNYGVHCFHATACLSQSHQFERLQVWQCEYVYKQLADILEKSTIQPIIAAVRSDDWASIANRNFNSVYESAYDFCIDRVIGQLVNWSSNHAGGSKVPVTIAMQKDHEDETNRTHQSWAKVKKIGDRIGALAHEFPDRFIPLQAADMLAHEFYRHETWRYAMDNNQSPPQEKLHPRCFNKIIRGRRMQTGGLYDRWHLEQAVLGVSAADST